MVAFLFAGQGSQYIGMGKDLYEAFPASKKIFDKADEVLGFPLSRLCFTGPEEDLTKTNNSQPAILTMSIAALEAYKTVVSRSSLVVSYMAGLSLGEYSALVAAGAISFEDAVYLVRRRGEFMEEEARKRPGTMLSVIGLDPEALKDICLKAHTEIANINCPGQIVISGGTKEILEAKALAKAAGAKMAVELEVSGAFHSSFMQGAALKLAAELNKIKISPARMAIVSNVSARPVTSPQEIRQNLIQQVASSVLWEDSMKFLLAEGVTDFIEFGPGKVLRGLMRRISTEARVINIEKKEDVLAHSG
jgi:[acyl-carrier-protein] S-malonyltransferase